MEEPDYDYTLEKLDRLEYSLAIEMGNIKQRLIAALTLNWISADELPVHLLSLHKKIDKFISSIHGDSEESAFQKSLRGKHLSTCKRIAIDIIELKTLLDDYIKSLKD